MPTIETVLHGFSLGTDQGTIGFCSITLIRGAKNILVDAAHIGRRELLLQKLREKGLGPGDIDYLFLTHAHWDHVLNIDLFPNARVLIHPLERDYCKRPKASDWATPSYTTLILESRQLQEVREGEEIDDGVTVLETPGHSRGSMALLVRSGSETVAISGDALPNGYAATTGLPRLIFWDVDQARGSIRKLLDRAQAFYPGHDRPFRLHQGHVAYLEQTSVRVFGWPDPGAGEGAPSVTYAADASRETRVIE
ncbi:MAG: MBL fold metallo-hydrolase [Chloroflexi bacterium]|nr:MBL fold metallo-hydrolase [Chloroflexota bacterium]